MLKRSIFTSLALFTQFSLAMPVTIVKTFDGLSAKCTENADINSGAFRLKNGNYRLVDDTVLLAIDVASYSCKKVDTNFKLDETAAGDIAYQGISTRDYKLVLTDLDYKLLGIAKLDDKAHLSRAEFSMRLNEEQLKTLITTGTLTISAQTFVQYRETTVNDSGLAASGSFNILIKIDSDSGSVQIR